MRNDIQRIKIKRIGEHLLPIPVQQTEGSAGFDLSCVEQNFILQSRQRKMIRTGFAWEIPQGFVGQVWPRSGHASKFGIDVLAGVIDSDFRGEIKVILINHGEEPVPINFSERIAQVLIVPVLSNGEYYFSFEELSDTKRGSGELGSTGIN